MKNLIFASLIIAALVIACGKENGTNPDTGPKIELSRNQVSFSALFRRTTVFVSNSGSGTLTWDITSYPEWVNYEIRPGQIDKLPDTLLISITEISEIEYGDFSSQIKISSNGGEVTLNLTLSNQAPLLKISKNVLNFSRNYRAETIEIRNDGGSELIWNLATLPPWLWASQTGDSMRAPSDEIIFAVNFEVADYGEYAETIFIESNGGNEEIAVYFLYERAIEVFPGRGAAGINIGDTFEQLKKVFGLPIDVIEDLGNETIKHNLNYRIYGLTFIIITQGHSVIDNTDTVSSIEMQSPYDGLTEKNIGIGSTLNQVVAQYGEPQTKDTSKRIYEYDIGISFYYNSNQEIIKMLVF